MTEQTLVQELKAKEGWICTVESCTGGLVAHRITNVSGSSAVYWGSWITYDNAAKERLGVDARLLREKGAVSEEVARALAEAGLRALQQSLAQPRLLLCVATTGIAGPTGGTPQKPVGLCYVAVASTSGPTQALAVAPNPTNDRLQNKALFAESALQLAERVLSLA